MFNVTIAATTVIFTKFFSAADTAPVLEAIPADTRRVVFLDTPATGALVATVEGLLARGVEVVVRDHHDDPTPRNARGEEIKAAAARLRAMVGADSIISNRGDHPACSTLIEAGEFAGDFIVADADLDGLTAAMKAAGVCYDGLDEDAAVLDGPRAGQSEATLSPLAFLLVRGLATVPPFNAARPEVSEAAKAALFGEFVAAASGAEAALASLGRKVEQYERGVAEAQRLAEGATQVAPGVWFVDVAGAPRHDLGTLAAALDARPGCRVTVVRKDAGPIAAACGGIQYSLAVVREHQQEVDLRLLLPEGFVSSPATGIISNTSFLLHTSPDVWDNQVLPALRERFAA